MEGMAGMFGMTGDTRVTGGASYTDPDGCVSVIPQLLQVDTPDKMGVPQFGQVMVIPPQEPPRMRLPNPRPPL
ncbi:hypothetical protein ALI22I_34985 [Saccharothrix sp. ALI-22-I]|uniref:hypothetical protein n=1 Tax=Saccharothrix sp. ALI-22-I TaxID=1933778 RepID=UPI0009D4DC1A|nr:hypothetical protein [Saccharothrix sp. ALI-22-I]ONI83673.1 hypothetical protein ALI22I_34985 [Saccharothrix sp. ALI-22-I]